MFCCNDKFHEKLHEEIECKTEETEKGIKVEITAKDPKKTEAFKALVKAHKAFFKDCCCN